MRIRFVLALLALVLAPAPPASAQALEGVIKLRTISVDREGLYTRGFDDAEAILDMPIERILALRAELESDGYLNYEEVETTFKGDLVRSDISAEGMVAWIVMDLDKGTMQMVQPAENMVMEMTRADMERITAMSGDMEDMAPEMEVVETGLTRKINGWNCVAYDVSNYEETNRVWVSNDDPRLTKAYRSFGEAMTKMSMGEEVSADFLVAEHGFPILSQRVTDGMYDIDEVISFERGSVSDALFVIPAGYRKINMAQMMGIGR